MSPRLPLAILTLSLLVGCRSAPPPPTTNLTPPPPPKFASVSLTTTPPHTHRLHPDLRATLATNFSIPSDCFLCVYTPDKTFYREYTFTLPNLAITEGSDFSLHLNDYGGLHLVFNLSYHHWTPTSPLTPELPPPFTNAKVLYYRHAARVYIPPQP